MIPASRLARLGGLVALGVALLQSPASAATNTICKAAAAGPDRVVACVVYDIGRPTPHTVTLYATGGCATWTNGHESAECVINDYYVGQTGFEPNPSYTPPTVTPNGDVIVYAGTVGTAYVNGSSRDVNTPPFCFGDPSVC